MAYIPQVEFVDFVDLVKIHWSIDYDLVKYKSEVARVARKARRHLFPHVSQKAMLAKECTLWRDWIAEIPQGEKVHPEWNRLVNFKESMIGSMAKGDGHEIFPFAIHYRFHRYHKQDDLQFADDIDRHALKKPLRKLGQQVFRYEPDIYDMLQPLEAPMSYPPYISKTTAQKLLENNRDDSIWLNPHNHHTIPLLGRDEEIATLRDFVENGGSFRILPVIAPSGAGKTRLISQWMRDYAANWNPDTEWEAGFLVSNGNENARDPTPWKSWTPRKNTLIVIDYTHAFDEVVKVIFERATEVTAKRPDGFLALSETRGAKDQFQKPLNVRLIVIDHTSPEFLWHKLQGGHAASVARLKAQYVVDELHLKPEKDNSQILVNILVAAANIGKEKNSLLELDDPQILHAMEQLDRIGKEMGEDDTIRHPLFAALFGQAIRRSVGGTVDFSAWSRRDLINIYFDGQDRLPWSGWNSTENPSSDQRMRKGLYAGALVSAATLRRGVSVADAREHLPRDHESILAQSRNVICSTDPHTIKEFLPDILGETFLMKFLAELDRDSDVEQAFVAIIEKSGISDPLEIASNFRETVLRLVRNLSKDDPTQPAVIKLWEELPKLLQPKKFQRNSPMRLCISHSIADVMDQLSSVSLGLKSTEGSDGIVYRFESLRAKLSSFFEVEALLDNSVGNAELESAQTALTFFESSDQKNYVSLFPEILKVLEKYEKSDAANWAPLLLAAFFGSTNFLQLIIEKLNPDIDMLSTDGWTALMLASQHGHLETMECLISNRANPNASGKEGTTAALLACSNGQVEALELLHRCGADLDGSSQNGVTLAHAASYNGHVKILRYLKKLDVDLFKPNKEGVISLLPASGMGHLDVVSFLIAEGADVNSRSTSGGNAAITASYGGHLRLLKYLHSLNIDLKATRNDGHTSVMSASENGHLPVLKFLHQHGVNLNAVRDDGANALLLACQYGHLNVVRYLESQAIDLNASNHEGWTAALVAIQYGQLDVLKFLHDKGAKLSVANRRGANAATFACQNGNLDLLQYLHDQGTDFITSSSHGWTPAITAAQGGHLQALKFLHKLGANLGATTNDGTNAAMEAGRFGHVHILRYLATQNVELNGVRSDGWNTVMFACGQGHLNVLQFLHKQEITLSAVAPSGVTSVMAATYGGHLEVVRYLYEKGVDLTSVTKNGDTAMSLAIERGHSDIVNFLCDILGEE